MAKLIFILLLAFVFLPAVVYGSVASDFTLNPQSIYAVPRDVSKILVLDLTLPEPLGQGTLKVESIKLHNAGTASSLDISKLMIWEDGQSSGWDNDETEAARILAAPFFDTEISGSFREYSKGDSWQRIFVTLDTTSETLFLTERSVQIELVVDSVVFSDASYNGPTDKNIIGFERLILHDAQIPVIPATPLAGQAEALSTSTIRWHFIDLSNNEFGFKILDSELNEVVRKEEADLSYLDETGLIPDTKYSGRRVVAFNDRGESLSSSLAVFPVVYTLAEEVEEEVEEGVEEEVKEEAKEEVEEEPTLLEKLQTKIAEIQQKINEIFDQLTELLKQQTAEIKKGFLSFFQSFFGK